MKRIMKDCKDFFYKHDKQIIAYSIIVILLFILVFAYMNLVKLIIFILIITISNTFMRFYKRALPGIPLEFELTIFSTVLIGIAYGIWPAIFIAIFSSLCADFLNQNIMSPFSLVSLGTYILIALVSPFLSSSNIFVIGMVIVVIANLIIFFGNIAMGYHDQIKNFAYSATNIFFNYFLFKYLAVFILGLLM